MTDQMTQDDFARLREIGKTWSKSNPIQVVKDGELLSRAADAMERLAPVVAAAESTGWNGVENSKILSQYILDLGEERDQLKAELANAQKAVDDNWVSHQQVIAANKERDRLKAELEWMADERDKLQELREKKDGEIDRLREAVKVLRLGLEVVADTNECKYRAAYIAKKLEQADAILAGKEGDGK